MFLFLDCKRLSSLKRLESITFKRTKFDKSIISCLSALPSLNTLNLRHSISLAGSFPFQGMCTSNSHCNASKLKFIFLIIHLLINNLKSSYAELSRLKDLQTLDLGNCRLNSLVFNGYIFY